MRRIQRQTLVSGLVFGLVIVTVDTVMDLFGPEPVAPNATQLTDAQFGTLCFNFVINCILYYLSGYIASSLTVEHNQGRYAGLIAGLVASVGGAVLFVVTHDPRLGQIPVVLSVAILERLVLSVPLGFVFGAIGGRIGAKQT